MSATAKRIDSEATHTPGPWDYVPSNEHHGPYVTSDHGSTICDCYVMSHPTFPSVRNGGPSRPIHFLHEMADPNARLIAAAPEMLAALKDAAEAILWYRAGNFENEHGVKISDQIEAVIAKAEGRP